MELEVAIVLMLGTAFLSLVGLNAFKKYTATETVKNLNNTQNDQAQLILKNTISGLENSNRAYVYKIKKLRENYDLDYDDVDFHEEDEEEFRLSDLATSIYPKLPPSLAKIIDKEEFQNAILKTVEKSPEIITTFVDKFLNKTSDQGSTSNTTPALKEKYL